MHFIDFSVRFKDFWALKFIDFEALRVRCFWVVTFKGIWALRFIDFCGLGCKVHRFLGCRVHRFSSRMVHRFLRRRDHRFLGLNSL